MDYRFSPVLPFRSPRLGENGAGDVTGSVAVIRWLVRVPMTSARSAHRQTSAHKYTGDGHEGMHRSGAYCGALLGSVAQQVCAIAHRAQLRWEHRRNEAVLTKNRAKERARRIMGHFDRATTVELTVCGPRLNEGALFQDWAQRRAIQRDLDPDFLHRLSTIVYAGDGGRSPSPLRWKNYDPGLQVTTAI